MTDVDGTKAEEAREGLAASPNRTVLGRFLRHPTAMASAGALIALALAALFAPVIAPGDPMRVDPVARFTAPGAEHFFGTDNLGRDIFKIVVHGARTSLLVGLVVTAVSVSIATVLGLLSGFFHRVDIVLMRLVDGVMAFPSIVLATAAAAYLGTSVSTVILALTFVLIAPSLRVVRGQVLVVRELQMIEAARATGVPTSRIFRHYVLPAVTSPILVQTSFIFSAAVLGEAALSFIGVGIGPTDLSWGKALTEARNYIGQAPWIVVFPGLALMITILALNLLGDSLRDILDPRLARSR